MAAEMGENQCDSCKIPGDSLRLAAVENSILLAINAIKFVISLVLELTWVETSGIAVRFLAGSRFQTGQGCANFIQRASGSNSFSLLSVKRSKIRGNQAKKAPRYPRIKSLQCGLSKSTNQLSGPRYADVNLAGRNIRTVRPARECRGRFP